MVAVEVSVLLLAARQAAARAGIRAVTNRFRKPELKEITSAFDEACRDTDTLLGSAIGQAVSLELGPQHAVAKLVEILLTAVVTGDLDEVAEAIAAAAHDRLDFGYSDVEASAWLVELARGCESNLRERATSAESPLYNWYSTVTDHADRVLLRRVAAGISLHGLPSVAVGPCAHDSSSAPTRLFRVPSPINRRATGRAVDLVRMEAALQRHPVLVLHGLGGVGKTQLVVWFATEHASDYDVVWSLSADHQEQMNLSLYDFGRALGVVAPDESMRNALSAVGRWLRDNDRWLLIFDAVADPDIVRAALPHPVRGHVAITSTNPNWNVLGTTQLVEELRRQDAASYLHVRAGRPSGTDADRLAALLGDLPLALEQAGAYCEQVGISFTSYIDRYQTAARRLLDGSAKPTDHPLSVASTFSLAMDGASAQHAAAVPFLCLCAVLARRPIPLDLLTAGASALTDPLNASLRDEAQCDMLVSALRRFSLVERVGEDLIMHRLVQDVVQFDLPADETQALVRAALAALRSALPPESWNPTHWPVYQRSFDHVMHLCDFDGATRMPDAAWLLDRAATYLGSLGLDRRACELFERAHALAAEVLGLTASETLSYLNNLGAAYQRTDPAKARGVLLEALELHEAAEPEGQEPLRLAEVLQNLGHAELALGMTSADTRFAAALAIYGRHVPESEWYHDTAIAHLINNIGLQQRRDGDHRGALRSFTRSAELHRKKYGPNHPEVARALRNAAVVQTESGDHAAAIETMDAVVAIFESVLGNEHPQLAVTLRERANTRRQLAGHDLEILEAARRDDLRAREIVERLSDSPFTERALCLNGLALDALSIGDAHRALGDHPASGQWYRDALELFRSAQSLREAHFGKRSADVVQSSNNVGRAHLRLDDLPAAEAAFRRSLSLLSRLDVRPPVLQGLAHDGLGEVAERREEWPEANARYTEALQQFSGALPSNSPTVRRTLEKIARAQRALDP